MTNGTCTFVGGPIFDGQTLHADVSALFEGGRLVDIGPAGRKAGNVIDLGGDILSPGYVDLQLNGGGGVMLNDDPSVETIRCIAEAHRGLGTVAFLPTLITDTPEKTRLTIEAVIAALDCAVPGVAGLHLEGPHLSVARKGAHSAALIRPMAATDLDLLLEARAMLPALMVTLAPETVSVEQVAALDRAGVVVSLGHTDADYETCVAYMKAGARCATHLFNAMSQMGHRAPGLVGAVLAHGDVSAGLIADGIHSHPASIQTAWRAKAPPGQIFLVSDSMAVAGTDHTEFMLEGRVIRRAEGRLTLEDGTLAGADLDLTKAVRVLSEQVHIPIEAALRAATSVPASMIGLKSDLSELSQSIRIAADLSRARMVV